MSGIVASEREDSTAPRGKQFCSAQPTSTQPASVPHILLVEDNVINQRVALGILQKLGLRADTAADGYQGVKALESISYDLVLMDVQMPVMDGLEATRHIRNPKSQVINHAVPIIAVTAHALASDRRRCLEAGMNDHLPKPVSFQALAETMARWLPKTFDHSKHPHAGANGSNHLAPLPVVFDRAGLLDRAMNDADLAQELVTMFLDSMPRLIDALHRHLQAGEAPAVERLAHTLKGSAASVGAEALRTVASELEKAGKIGDLGVAATHLAELEREADRLEEEIRTNDQRTDPIIEDELPAA